MARILAILDRNGFDGVVIPDHAPQMSCESPWQAGMAHTLGFVVGVLAMLKKQRQHDSEVAEVAISAAQPAKIAD
jgi:mannonate dehydratase